MILFNEDGTQAGYYDVINWWLEHYKGMEYLHENPETMYTVTSILERCFELLNKQEVKKNDMPKM